MNGRITTPREFAYCYWPEGFSKVNGSPRWFYDKQWEMLDSLWYNDVTEVVAANLMGKDFAAGFGCLAFFALKRRGTCRVVTTSIREDHLRVLWGEIGRFVSTAKYGLTVDRGGFLIPKHRDMRRLSSPGRECDISYLRGMVSEKGEGMAGHHADSSLLVGDEASGLDDVVFEQGDGWAGTQFYFGNPNPCNNRFRRLHDEWEASGDVPDPLRPGRFIRKVIRIRAEDSPNVRLALAQQRRGEMPTNEVLVPGILRWENGTKGYVYRRKFWDRVRQTIGLDAKFYKGSEVLLYPPHWLDRAEQFDASLEGRRRVATSMGVDPGEGEAESSWCIGDELGVIELFAKRTPDTTEIPIITEQFMRLYNLRGEQVIFDRGGGGKEHADRMRRNGHAVRTVAFGEAVTLTIRGGVIPDSERREAAEQRSVYKNRRAQMFWELRGLLDPSSPQGGFGIPARYTELRRQLAPIPVTTDREGQLYILPKQRRDPGSRERTLTELIGCSPDQADSLVLMVHGLLHEEVQAVAGAF